MALTKYERNKRWRKNRPQIWLAGKKRYYDKSRMTASNAGQYWTADDIQFVIDRKFPDSFIAEIIGRSVMAIQMMRLRLKKKPI